jgi:hypothetical protein
MSHPSPGPGTPAPRPTRRRLLATTGQVPRTHQVWPLTGIPEIEAGGDRGSVILDAADPPLADGNESDRRTLPTTDQPHT